MARDKILTHEDAVAQLEKIDTTAVFAQSLAEKNHYSFLLNRDPQVLDVMKHMVDREKLKKLLAIGGSHQNYKIAFPKNEFVDQLIDIWANNKYEYFVLFGYSFYLTKVVDVNFGQKDNAIRANLDKIAVKYPEAAALINQISNDQFADNKVNYVGNLERFFPFFKSGMKATALFAKLYPNKNFIDDLSLALTERGQAGRIVVSIDPCDYLTASLNNNGWSSCFSIASGFEHGGTMAWMLDKISLIAFLSKDDESQYNTHGLKFIHNNKLWRQMYAFDLKTISFRGSTQYPRYSDELEGYAKEMIKAMLTSHIGEHPAWVNGGIKRSSFTKPAHDYHYNEVKNYSKNALYLKTTEKPDIVYETYPHLHCVYCGNTNAQYGLFACPACQQNNQKG